jgi:nucleoside-diphosphate-sugar epimerase
MKLIEPHDSIVGQDDRILVTGATGFIGSRLVANLLERGFRNIRCFARPSSAAVQVDSLSGSAGATGRVEVIKGNLLSREDCHAATKDVAVIYHLAAGRGEKSFPDAFMNSVVTTRNLLDAGMQHKHLRRFVNVSSLTVYNNAKKLRWRMLDESCPVETQPELRGEAYYFAKLKQDEMVTEYGKKFGIPCVIVRPGVVYGPGNNSIHGRVGIGTFGLFLHLGGSNAIPFTYVDNCADAIALVGLKSGTDGEVFNIMDDDLPSSRQFLRLYKRQVRQFKSIYVPHILSYALCYGWERYSEWSQEQLPPVFNRRRWHANWRKTYYSNAKLKEIGWIPKVPTAEGLKRYFEACRNGGQKCLK